MQNADILEGKRWNATLQEGPPRDAANTEKFTTWIMIPRLTLGSQDKNTEPP